MSWPWLRSQTQHWVFVRHRFFAFTNLLPNCIHLLSRPHAQCCVLAWDLECLPKHQPGINCSVYSVTSTSPCGPTIFLEVNMKKPFYSSTFLLPHLTSPLLPHHHHPFYLFFFVLHRTNQYCIDLPDPRYFPLKRVIRSRSTAVCITSPLSLTETCFVLCVLYFYTFQSLQLEEMCSLHAAFSLSLSLHSIRSFVNM